MNHRISRSILFKSVELHRCTDVFAQAGGLPHSLIVPFQPKSLFLCRVEEWLTGPGGFHSHAGIPKWMLYDGTSYEIWWFGGTPILGNHHMNDTKTYSERYCAPNSCWKKSKVRPVLWLHQCGYIRYTCIIMYSYVTMCNTHFKLYSITWSFGGCLEVVDQIVGPSEKKHCLI